MEVDEGRHRFVDRRPVSGRHRAEQRCVLLDLVLVGAYAGARQLLRVDPRRREPQAADKSVARGRPARGPGDARRKRGGDGRGLGRNLRLRGRGARALRRGAAGGECRPDSPTTTHAAARAPTTDATRRLSGAFVPGAIRPSIDSYGGPGRTSPAPRCDPGDGPWRQSAITLDSPGRSAADRWSCRRAWRRLPAPAPPRAEGRPDAVAFLTIVVALS